MLLSLFLCSLLPLCSNHQGHRVCIEVLLKDVVFGVSDTLFVSHESQQSKDHDSVRTTLKLLSSDCVVFSSSPHAAYRCLLARPAFVGKLRRCPHGLWWSPLYNFWCPCKVTRTWRTQAGISEKDEAPGRTIIHSHGGSGMKMFWCSSSAYGPKLHFVAFDGCFQKLE